jgi:xylulokinase
MSLLGIDIGTSGCKAVAFSEDGRALASAYEEYDYRQPQPGWAELDTMAVWAQIQHIIRAAANGAAHDTIKAVCISSLGEAVVPVTADRQILGPSLLNFDSRGAEYIPTLRERMSDTRLHALNGNTLGNSYTLPKLLWLRQHQPDLYQRADWFLHWSGFVSFMLGAEPVVDDSLANRTLLFDLESRNWSDELLDWAQFDQTKLPPAVASGTVIGGVARSIADELGLPAGIPIVSGGHDQCCNGVGCGVIQPGQAMYGMGTYICVMPVFGERPPSDAMKAQGFCTEHHAVPGRFVSFLYNQGGALVKWFRDTFAAAERKQAAADGTDIYAALMAEMPAEPSRVMVLPHFTATGPPEFVADSSGVITGLHLDTSRGEILKGLLEATTFYLRACIEALPDGVAIADFRAAGGGSKSSAWLQICADILGRPVTQPQVNEAGTLGAAILAGVGGGVFPNIEAGVKAMVRPAQQFHPQSAVQSRYNERFAEYQQLWPLMKNYLRSAKDLTGLKDL